MPNNVESRIVQMEFDNAQFEKGAKQTLTTLEKLDDALAFKDVGKGIDSLNTALNKLDFSSLTTGIDSVGKSFTAMEAISFGVFERIGTKIADLGMKIGNELLVAQKKAGFAEYEMELGSVQTINASTGKSFKEIYGYLAELNKYADETIYSFSDMTRNIGKFTNAGVELETAVKAIQGISNEAAVSGANAEEASRAMYNFAQALSSGAVKLIDWKSIENANMATVEFKEELMKTALELGTIQQEGDKFISTTVDLNGKISDAFTATTGFNDSLAHQWMTTEVLTKTLARYSDATTEIGKKAFAAAQDVKTFSQLIDTLKEAIGSGWSESFRIVIGEFEDAKKLWTGVSNTLGGVVDAFSNLRNHALRYWKQEGGRTKLLNSLIRLWKIFDERVKIVGEAFKETFPAISKTGHILMNVTNQFSKFTKNLKNGFLGNKEALEDFRERVLNVLNGISLLSKSVNIVAKSIKKIFLTAITAVKNELGEVASITTYFERFAEWIFNAAKAFGMWASSSKTLATVTNVAKGLYGILQAIAARFNSGIIGKSDKIFKSFGLIVLSVRDALYSFGVIAATVIKSFVSGFDKTEGFADIFEKIAIFVSGAAKAFKEWVTNGERLKYLSQTIKGIAYFASLIIEIAKQVVTAVSPIFKQASKSDPIILKITARLAGLVKGILDFVKETKIVEKVITGVISLVKSFMPLVGGIKDGVGFIFKGQVSKGLKAIGSGFKTTFSYIIDGIRAFVRTKGSLKDSFGFFDSFSGIIKALEPIAAKFKSFMASTFGGFGEFISETFGVGADIVKTVGKIFASSLDFIAEAFTTVYSLIRSLGKGISSAVKSIVSTLSIDGGTLDEIFSTIGEGLKNLWLGLTENPIETFAAFKIFTTLDDTMKNLTSPLSSLTTLSDSISDALGETTGILNVVRQAADDWQKNKTVDTFKTIATSMLILAAAIAVIALAFHGDGEAATTGLLAVTSLLWEMSAVIQSLNTVIPNPLGISSVTSAMLKMAVAMILMGYAMKKMVQAGKENPEQLSVALIAMLSLMRAMAATIDSISLSMPNPKMLNATSLGMVRMSVAMFIMAKGLESLAKAGGNDLVSFVIAVSALLVMLKTMTGVIEKLSNLDYDGKKVKAAASAMIKMSVALVVMSLAVKTIAKSASGNMQSTVIAVLGIVAILNALSDVVQKLIKSTPNTKMLKSASSMMIKMAGALYVISLAVASVAKVGRDGNTESLVISILGLIAIMEVLVALVLKLADEAGNLSKKGATSSEAIGLLVGAMLSMAFAMVLLAPAVKLMGEMNPDNLRQGLLGLVAVMSLTLGFVLALSKIGLDASKLKMGIATIAAIIITLQSFTAIVMALSIVDPKRLLGAVEAFVVMSAVMYGLIFGITELSKNAKPDKILAMAGAMVIMSTAFSAMAVSIFILSTAISAVAGYSFDDLIPGVAMLAALIAAIVVTMAAMNSLGGGQGSVGMAAALFVMALAMNELAKVLIVLQNVNFDKAAGGLLLLGTLLVGLTAISAYAPQIQAMALAFLTFGAASALFGVGILLAAKGVLALVQAVVLLAKSWKKIKKMSTEFIKLLGTLVPMIIDVIVEGLVDLLKKMADVTPTIISTLTKLLKDVFYSALQMLVEVLGDSLPMILDILDLLKDYGKPIIERLFDIIMDVLAELDKRVPDLLVYIGSIAIKLIVGILDWIIYYIPVLAEKIFDAVVALIYAIAALFDDEHVDAFLEAARTLYNNLVNAFIKVVNEGMDELIKLGPKIIGGIAKGMSNSLSSLGEKLGEGVSDAVEAGKEKVKEFKKLGKKFISAIIKGMKAGWKDLKENVEMFGESVVETLEDAFLISSPSKRTEEDGKYIDMGLGKGISKNAGYATDASEEVAGDVSDVFSSINYDELINGGDNTIMPELTPVINGDSLDSSASELTDALSGRDSLLKDYTSDISFGETSTDLSQETYDTVNASFNDETKQMYNELKDAINDLTEMLDGMIIVDENTNNTTNIKVDGETIATATAPYFNAKMVKDASKAKSKTATSKR